MKRYGVGVCLILAVSLFGVSAGILYRWRAFSRVDGVTLEPAVIEPADDVFEGQQLTFHFVLQNKCERPVSVEEVVPSCGCMTVPSVPIMVPSVPIMVETLPPW